MLKNNQNVETPQPFFDAVQRFFNVKFVVDLAASDENKKCRVFCSEEHSAFDSVWPTDCWCWLNPPFGQLSRWIDRLSIEVDRGCKIISIWPLSGDLNQIKAWKHSSVYVVHGRVWPQVRGLMMCKWDRCEDKNILGVRWHKSAAVPWLERIW